MPTDGPLALAPARRRALVQGKRALLRAFGTDPSVTAFGYGFRRRDGRLSDEPVVVASVGRKRPPGYVSRDSLLPRTVEVDGRRYGVDVVQAGPFHLGGFDLATRAGIGGRRRAAAAGPVPVKLPALPADLTDPILEWMRPARQGCSIANVRTAGGGTYGCLVSDLSNGGQPAVLGSGHALGSLRGARVGDLVAQPAAETPSESDAIGRLRRFTTLRKDRPNRVDAAVVGLNNPDGDDVDTLVANHLMPAIQPSHPILGIVVGNASDASTLFARIGPVLDEMGVDFFGRDSSYLCAEPDFNANVDKVGAHTGYTSSVVVAMGVTPVNLGQGNVADYYVFDDLVQVDSGFTFEGDAGAAVCLGGDGNVRVPLPGVSPCDAMVAAEEATGLPLVGDEALADRFRDSFLAMTRTGRMLTRLFYVNFRRIVDRTRTLALTLDEKDWLAGLYDQYHDFVEAALTGPDDPRRVVTDQHISDVNFTLAGLTMSGRMSQAETDAVWALYAIFERTLGMNRRQLIAMLNDTAVYRQVYDILATVPTIEHLGAFGADD